MVGSPRWRPSWLAAVFSYCILSSLPGFTDARHMLQQNMVCVVFVPFRPADYTYVSTFAAERRRESFKELRLRASTITQTATPDALWAFGALDGSEYVASEAQALTAFPDMNKRSSDLYASYLIEALESITGVDLNDNIGKSSKMPYYYAHELCSGVACSGYTPGEVASIQAQTQGARGTVSCASDPNELALPFTEDGEQLQAQQADSIESLLANGNGGPVVFESSGAQADLAAAQSDSQNPIDTLFIPAPAPELALEPLLAPAPAPAELLALTPLAAFPGAAPALAPGVETPGAAGPGPTGVVDRSGGPGDCQGGDECDYEEPRIDEGGPSPDIAEGRATSGDVADIDGRDYPLSVVLVVVGIAVVLAMGVCALIAFGVVRRRRRATDSSAKPLFAIGPESTGSFTYTPDSGASPRPALVNPRPSDSSPAIPPLAAIAPLGRGSASGRGASARALGSAGSAELEGWAFGSVNGNSKGPYTGAPGLLRSTSHSGSVSLAHLTHPAAHGHGSSASQAGASQLDTLSSQGESAGLPSGAAGGSGAAGPLASAHSGSSSPERKLSDGAQRGPSSADGSGGSNAMSATAGSAPPSETGLSVASPRRMYQRPAGARVAQAKDAQNHALGTVFEGSDSHEIRDSMSHSVALDTSGAPHPGAGGTSAFATAELLVAASPAAGHDTDELAQRLAVTDAISEEELEQAGRPRPLGAILSEMTAELDERDGGDGSGSGWARGDAVEPPQSEEAPGPLPALGHNGPSRSRTASASTGASIQLPGFPTPHPARDTSKWADSAAGRPRSPTAHP